MTGSVPRIAAICCLAILTSAGAQGPPAPGLTRETLLLAVDRLLAERWYPDDGRPKPRVLQDQKLLAAAFTSPLASLRALAVRSLGRFENRLDVPTISAMLGDSNSTVRCEAANALVMSTHTSEGPDVVPAMQALMLPIAPATGAQGTSCQLNALARLHYDRDTAIRVLKIFAPGVQTGTIGRTVAPGRAFGEDPIVDLYHVLVMLRRDPTLPLDSDSLRVIRKEARPPAGAPHEPSVSERPPDVSALEILGLIHDPDQDNFAFAATWHCHPPPILAAQECGWPTRLLGVRGLDASSPAGGSALAIARQDVVPIVKVEALRRYGAAIGLTHDCEPIAAAAWDELERDDVRAEAVRLLDTRCPSSKEIAGHLRLLAATLGNADASAQWPLAIGALEALVKFDPAAAKPIVADMAVKHPVWHVRSRTAAVAVFLEDEPTVVTLARDIDPNVRYEALKGLITLQSAALTETALAALDSDDDQLVAGAATALKSPKPSETSIVKLAATLNRLTTAGRDTSRIPRLAILERLAAWASPDAPGGTALSGIIGDLQGLLTDFDPVIAAKASAVLAAAGLPRAAIPYRRPPQQPTEEQLRHPPLCAVITASNGDVTTLMFLSQEAPLTVARFETLAKAGAFNGAPLVYRLDPFETWHGGSPHGNDLSGDGRFLRDEIGMVRHTVGTVSLESHGRDTGDMRFVVNVIPQPKFDYEFTVFAGGVGNVRQTGATITSITLLYPPRMKCD